MSKKKIALFDIGHGGHDSGAKQFATGRKESDDVLKLWFRIKHFLSKCDLVVKATRETDVFVNLYDRPAYSNQIKADIMVSLHRNSGATVTDTTANGVEIWVHPQAPAVDMAIAQDMLERLAQAGIQSNRGVKYGRYVVLTCHAPAVMLELGFMNNVKDNQLFDTKLDGYAKAIAMSVCVSLGVEYIDPQQPAQPKPPEVLTGYRVVVAFNTDDKYAKANLEKAKKSGFKDAYLMAHSTERAEKE